MWGHIMTLTKWKSSKPMMLQMVFTDHKQVIIWPHMASKIIMLTSKKSNFLISNISQFSLGRNRLTYRLPLLLSFLNLVECTDINNPKASESLHFSQLCHISVFLSSQVFSELCRFSLPPTFYPSFFLLILSTPSIVFLLNFLMLVPGFSKSQHYYFAGHVGPYYDFD